MVMVVLYLKLRCQHDGALALRLLSLGLIVFKVGLRELNEGEAALFGPCTLVRRVEHLQGRAQVIMYGKLHFHLDVPDAIGKRQDDGLV